MRLNWVKSPIIYICSSDTAFWSLSIIYANWVTGQVKNRWTCFVNVQQDCSSMQLPLSGSLMRRTTIPRSSWITSYSCRRVSSSKLVQYLTCSTCQFSRRHIVVTTQKMIPECSLFWVLLSLLQTLSPHPPSLHSWFQAWRSPTTHVNTRYNILVVYTWHLLGSAAHSHHISVESVHVFWFEWPACASFTLGGLGI